MTASSFSPRGTASVALQQIALTATLVVLAIAWLHIPDANPFEVLASVLLGLLIAAVAGAGQSAIALRLVSTPATTRRLMLGTAVLLLAALLWYIFALGVDRLSVNDASRAGYLNSRLPASLRNIFSYLHLLQWLAWFWSALRWIAAGLLAAAAFACITAHAPVQATFAIIRSRSYWLPLVLLIFVGTVLTGILLDWMPGHGLPAELLSLVLRLLTLVLLSAGSLAGLLQAMAHAVLRTHSTGIADPATSQPRTAGIP